ncbi:MAG: hypothetical protein M1828_000698 [Chrysothrix sp. TS-e1954]|nr:MAG: hypothetical protein M1828_000698 [Chrysothrix sp. TS-e1954]
MSTRIRPDLAQKEYFGPPADANSFQGLLNIIFRSPDDSVLKQTALEGLRASCKRSTDFRGDDQAAFDALKEVFGMFKIHLTTTKDPLILKFNDTTLKTITLQVKPPRLLTILSKNTVAMKREFDIGSERDLGDLITLIHREQKRSWHFLQHDKAKAQTSKAKGAKFRFVVGLKRPLPRNYATAAPVGVRGTPRGFMLTRARHGLRNFQAAPGGYSSIRTPQRSPLHAVQSLLEDDTVDDSEEKSESEPVPEHQEIWLVETHDNARQIAEEHARVHPDDETPVLFFDTSSLTSEDNDGSKATLVSPVE